MENLNPVIGINSKKFFDSAEAESMVDLLLTITRKSKQEVTALNAQMSFLAPGSERFENLQREATDHVKRWSAKMIRLGLVPLSLWKVKIPCDQQNSFVWEFPSDQLKHLKN